jgi:hypothetical protein
MKKIYIFNAFFFFAFGMIGQDDLHCTLQDKSIDTNPLMPQYECNLSPFNWWMQTFTFSLGATSPPGQVSVNSPYRQLNPFKSVSSAEYIDPSKLFYLDEQTGDLRLYPGGVPSADSLPVADWEAPDKGWEFLLASSQFLAQPPDHMGYILLYNKHSSIIRVFFVIPPLGVNKAINLKISYLSSDVSGLLNPNAGRSRALDQPSLGTTSISTLDVNTFAHFMYLDIPVEYDPCTCTNELELNLEFWRVKEMLLDLFGRYFGLNRTLAEIAESDVQVLDSEFLTNVYLDQDYTDRVGSAVYSQYQDLTNAYKKIKDENDQLQNRYNRIQAFEKGMKLAAATGGPFLKAFSAWEAIKITVDDTDYKYTGSDLLKTTGAGFDYFSANVKKKLDKSNKVQAAVGSTSVSHGEMAFRGKIVEEAKIGDGVNLVVPGSLDSEALCVIDPNPYPRYNQKLGRMAVLRTPKAEVKEYLYTDYQLHDELAVMIRFDGSSLDYIFNTANGIDVENTEVWASLEVVTGGSAMETNLTEVFTGENGSSYSTPVMPLECLTEFVGLLRNFSMVDHPGLHVPVLLPLHEINLKLFVSYQFDDGGSQFVIYTYPCDITQDFIQAIEPSEIPYGETTPSYPDELVLSNRHFDHSQVIFAWNSIIIEGALTASPDVKVEIIAPDIKVLDGASIGSDIWLYSRIVPFASCSPQPEFPRASLENYCNSSIYKAKNSSLAPPPDEEALAQPPAPVPPAPGASLAALQVEAYPNPLSGYATLRLLLPEEGAVSASLSDLQGRPLRQVLPAGYLPAGERLFDLPAHDLAPGMYLLTVQTAQGRQSIKLVKR